MSRLTPGVRAGRRQEGQPQAVHDRLAGDRLVPVTQGVVREGRSTLARVATPCIQMDSVDELVDCQRPAVWPGSAGRARPSASATVGSCFPEGIRPLAGRQRMRKAAGNSGLSLLVFTAAGKPCAAVRPWATSARLARPLLSGRTRRDPGAS